MIKKSDIKNIIIIGIVAGIISFLMGELISVSASPFMKLKEAFSSIYQNKITLLLFLTNITEGLAYSLGFYIVVKALPQTKWKRGILYGFLLLLLASAPATVLEIIPPTLFLFDMAPHYGYAFAIKTIFNLMSFFLIGIVISLLYNKLSGRQADRDASAGDTQNPRISP